MSLICSVKLQALWLNSLMKTPIIKKNLNLKPSKTLCRGNVVNLMEISAVPFLGQHFSRTCHDSSDRLIAAGRHIKNNLYSDRLMFTFTVKSKFQISRLLITCSRFFIHHSDRVNFIHFSGYKPKIKLILRLTKKEIRHIKH